LPGDQRDRNAGGVRHTASVFAAEIALPFGEHAVAADREI
jgi:hypothetical protein